MMEIRARYVLIGLFTLAVILGGFAFVFWLNHVGGLGERTAYRVRFENSISGLGLGSDVFFNGIRVGEVTGVGLNPEAPGEVIVTIGVAADTPVRADTRVGLSYGGLTGTAAVALTGGTASAPKLEARNGEPPLLVADIGSAQDWTAAARDAFNSVDKLVTENSDSLHDAIDNINTFAKALARNSDKVDNIVKGLEKMTASAAAPPATIYNLNPVTDFPAGLTPPSWQLVVTSPTSAVTLDTQHFLVASGSSLNLAYDDARWADSVPNLVRETVIRSFENAGYVNTGGDMQGLTADRQLLMDIRAFNVVDGDAPTADVEFSAKVVDANGTVMAGKDFQADGARRVDGRGRRGGGDEPGFWQGGDGAHPLGDAASVVHGVQAGRRLSEDAAFDAPQRRGKDLGRVWRVEAGDQ